MRDNNNHDREELFSRRQMLGGVSGFVGAGIMNRTGQQKDSDPSESRIVNDEKIDGYRGIWFTLGQLEGRYGDKYAGGFGTYTMKHVPLATYASEVDKTFFTYGGTRKEETEETEQDLLVMASYYDHRRNHVPKPTIVEYKEGVIDPHDNGSISIGENGHIWIFVSGRSTERPGYKYRSIEPYSVEAFERISEEEMTYPQPWYTKDTGFLHFFTKYTDGRELYWETSDPSGATWSQDRKLAGFGGHYQTSAVREGTHVTAFNWHPDGVVDRRTNLYVLQTDDHGDTWKTMDGTPIETPLTSRDNEALVIDYQAQDRLVYLNELNFDDDGNPIIQYVTSDDFAPGPEGDPRHWHVTHWNGRSWDTNIVTQSDHNYDAGSIYVTEDDWTIIGPTETGPQAYHTGGEMAIWRSPDEGHIWEKSQQITVNSEHNHTYARRPRDAADPFFVFWADGDASQPSKSRLYFSDSTGENYYQLPYDMDGKFAKPISQDISSGQ